MPITGCEESGFDAGCAEIDAQKRLHNPAPFI